MICKKGEAEMEQQRREGGRVRDGRIDGGEKEGGQEDGEGIRAYIYI